MSAHRVKTNGITVELTKHAIERYIEKVKPGYSFSQSMAELRRLAMLARHVETVRWHYGRVPRGGYLLLTDTIAMPLKKSAGGRSAATTILIQGGISQGVRDHRNKVRSHQHRKHRDRVDEINRAERERRAMAA